MQIIFTAIRTCPNLANPYKFITLNQPTITKQPTLMQVSIGDDVADYDTAKSACEAEGARLAEFTTANHAHMSKVVGSEYENSKQMREVKT